MGHVRIALIALLCFMWQGSDMPCVRHLECPRYSQIARMARVQGEVALDVAIGPEGTVMSVTSRSGHPILRRDAEENVKTWIFTKGSQRHVEIVYEFKLDPPAVSYIPQSRVILELPNRVVVISQPPKTDH